jgi:hypothetical protein
VRYAVHDSAALSGGERGWRARRRLMDGRLMDGRLMDGRLMILVWFVLADGTKLASQVVALPRPGGSTRRCCARKAGLTSRHERQRSTTYADASTLSRWPFACRSPRLWNSSATRPSPRATSPRDAGPSPPVRSLRRSPRSPRMEAGTGDVDGTSLYRFRDDKIALIQML